MMQMQTQQKKIEQLFGLSKTEGQVFELEQKQLSMKMKMMMQTLWEPSHDKSFYREIFLSDLYLSKFHQPSQDDEIISGAHFYHRDHQLLLNAVRGCSR